MAHAKALARFLYANVPGLAAVRFAAKDRFAPFFVKPEFRGVSHLAHPGGLIVDVGANRGQSIEALRRFAPAANIVAFEPEPRSVVQLQKRYRRDRSITIHGCALGSLSGTITFFVPKYGWWNCDGMSATDHKTATDWLRDPGRMLLFDEARLTVEKHNVDCKTLDSFDLAPYLVKLHAQDAELDILKGSQKTIERHRPALMTAFASAEVNEFLEGWDYRPYDYRNGHFEAGVAKRPRTFTWYMTDDRSKELPIR